jgi:fluoroquinolone transport system ATP-binding protein
MTYAFSVNNLRYKYPKATSDMLKDITFSVEEGEIFGFLGPSGAGKSTTQKVLIKLLENYSGEIRYFDRDLQTMNQSYYEEVGVGFEMPIHFSKMTALENMRYFSGFYKNKADFQELMERMGLWEHKDIQVGNYSKGMKTRLNFVRAMLNKPRVLFLDEPTAGLDPKNARILKDIISEYRANGGTVFLTTHLMNDVDELCDRVIFGVNGKVTAISTPRDLKIKYGKREVKVEYKQDGITASVLFPLAGIGGNEEFHTLLRTKEIETIHSGETSMEDIFIKVTGVELK